MPQTQREHTEHTPTPWYISHNSYQSDSLILGKNEIGLVAIVPITHYSKNVSEIQKANARHIVHCVNSHDELVEALKGLLDNLNNDNVEEFEIKSREALANAQKVRI